MTVFCIWPHCFVCSTWFIFWSHCMDGLIAAAPGRLQLQWRHGHCSVIVIMATYASHTGQTSLLLLYCISHYSAMEFPCHHKTVRTQDYSGGRYSSNLSA